MDMADYSEALDPAYTTLEFENMQVLPLGTGESNICTSGAELWHFYWFKTLVRRGRSKLWHEVIKRGQLSIRSRPQRDEPLLCLSLSTLAMIAKHLEIFIWENPFVSPGRGKWNRFQLVDWCGVRLIFIPWWSSSLRITIVLLLLQTVCSHRV